MIPPDQSPAPQRTPDAPHAPEPQFDTFREESQFTKSGAAVVHTEQDFREAELASDLDITAAHATPAPVAPREGGDGRPSPAAGGFIAVPTWLLVLFGGVMLWAGVYLGTYSGGFKANVFNEVPGTGGGGPPVAVDPVKLGEKLFNANCAQCHQQTGLGQAGQFPPLAASEWVVGSTNRLSHILMRGIQGSIRVKGEMYNNQMPAWNTLKDEQVAAILTYIRQAWGNSASPITKEQIAAARKESEAHTEAYTEAELLKMPEGDTAGAPQKQTAGPPAGTTVTTAPATGNPPPDPAKKP